MRVLDRLTTEDIELDFSTAGLSRVESKRLHGGEHLLLSNAITLVQFEDPLQVLLCESCGCAQCSSGGWISLRRLGDHVILCPAFDRMSEGEWELTEFAPPGWARSGIPVLGRTHFTELRALISDLPPLEGIATLTAREAVLCLQWEAPASVLGTFPSPPQLDGDVVLAVSDGDPRVATDRFDELLTRMLASHGSLRVVDTECTPITFYLDLPSTPAWTPIARLEGDGSGLTLWPDAVAVREVEGRGSHRYGELEGNE